MKKQGKLTEITVLSTAFFVTMVIVQRFLDFFRTAPNEMLCLEVQKECPVRFGSGSCPEGGERGYINREERWGQRIVEQMKFSE